MDNILDNPIYAQDLVSKRKTCYNCWHWRNSNCALYSCECATQVAHRTGSPRWVSYEDGEESEKGNFQYTG